MTTDDMENLVFALGSKKAMSRLHKDMQDLVCYQTSDVYEHQYLVFCTTKEEFALSDCTTFISVLANTTHRFADGNTETETETETQ